MSVLITHRSGTLFWLGVIRVKAWRLPRRQLESRVKIVAGVQDIIEEDDDEANLWVLLSQ